MLIYSPVSHSVEVLGSQARIPKGLKKLSEIPEGWKGMGGRTFWNFRRQTGFKMFMPPVVGNGYFLESPIIVHDIVSQFEDQSQLTFEPFSPCSPTAPLSPGGPCPPLPVAFSPRWPFGPSDPCMIEDYTRKNHRLQGPVSQRSRNVVAHLKP